MPLDASFRSRLREALQQSLVGRRTDAGPALPQGARSESNPPEAGSPRRELRYEPEDDPRERADAEQAAWIADALGGCWNRDAGGVCLVVDRRYAGDRVHGSLEIGGYAEALARHGRSLLGVEPVPAPPESPTLFDAGSGTPFCGSMASGTGLDADRFLFFDLETTGLSGGAGTCAFLIGYGWFDGDCFRTRQYFLGGYAHEPALLRMAAEPLSGTILASFNGKTFDVPLVTGRYLFHRVPSPFETLRHIDLLHPARRLWRHRPGDRPLEHDRHDRFAQYFRATALRAGYRAPGRYTLAASAASCTLGALEDAVLGFRRTDDVPGSDIPARYFHYVRTGDARSLVPVLEHNRLDLLSLAALASLVARMLEEGPQATRNAHECLALGRLYERSGAGDRAVACYERAAEDRAGVPGRDDPTVRREALRRLAMRHRRERRYEDAAAAWQQLLDLTAAEPGVDFQAVRALAVHHEHRSKNLQAARALIIHALDSTHDRHLDEAFRHRLARLDRKLAAPYLSKTVPQ